MTWQRRWRQRLSYLPGLLSHWLRLLASWIDPPPPADPIDKLASILVGVQNARWPDRSGEAKRHQVYADLINAFPDVNKRILARAIEDALEG